MAMVVLPVLRSPMISSRWPRPIGVIASMALMPVCSGSCTGLRPVMPGAWISMRRGSAPAMRALAVDGLAQRVDHAAEQGVADGHREDAPGGLDGLALLDAVDVAEDRRRRSTPRRGSAPDRAVPSSNSSSSLTAASGSPATRAMPSPTSRMRPTWSTHRDVEGLKPSRFLRERGGDVVAVLMVQLGHGSSSSISDPVLQLLEPVTDRAVDDRVADAGDDAAEHRSGRRRP